MREYISIGRREKSHGDTRYKMGREGRTFRQRCSALISQQLGPCMVRGSSSHALAYRQGCICEAGKDASEQSSTDNLAFCVLFIEESCLNGQWIEHCWMDLRRWRRSPLAGQAEPSILETLHFHNSTFQHR